MKGTTQQWTNESVLKFAGQHDPIRAIVQAARDLVLAAIDQGWRGPPFDPIKLAEMEGIVVSPRADIPDARTVSLGPKRFQIEYNPTRPPGRLRYSIAHEIAHTLFPDCGNRVRNRNLHGRDGDDWQLEALCNIAAAEILMPLGSMAKDQIEMFDIAQISKARKTFQVSTEAVLIRLAHLSDERCVVFVASKHGPTPSIGSYSFDYLIPSRNWQYDIVRGTKLPDVSPVAECTAVGFTATGEMEFPQIPEKLRIECIGIPPYPGAIYPRVAGFLSSRKRSASSNIKTLQGDVLKPRGNDRKIIAHVVSDATANWGGGGVAVALKRKWPLAQNNFRNWFGTRPHPKLGEVHFCPVDREIEVASIVAQHGYGPSEKPRIRYAALESALQLIATHAKENNASIHIPRIGCGQAGGAWMLVQELIGSTLLAANLSVTVYDLPQTNTALQPAQLSLEPVS